MPIRPCPTCQRPTTRVLPEASLSALVSYYRCDHCGHVWSTPKDSPDAPYRTVSPGIIPEQECGKAPPTQRDET
jgi:uncharacterized Zn finger protein